MDRVSRSKDKAHQVTVVRPNPMLWKAALRQADGDAKRIEIISETNLVVHPPRR